jgi:hypothetical protein
MVGQALRAGDFPLEARLDLRVGSRRLVIEKFVVVHEKIGFQDVHLVEFPEQVGGGLRSGAQRVAGMRPLPLLKRLVGPAEIQVVHVAISRIHGRCGRQRVGQG